MPPKTPLEEKITRLIGLNSPISLADYMHLCLNDPDHGYYATGHPIGTEGDFITAPEISQIFGELIGVWIIDTWQKLGRPSPFALVEFGPGRGTLFADILRVARLDTDFLAAAKPCLVEASPALRQQQAKTLHSHHNNISWINSTDEIPAIPIIAIANEFLDALPFRQYVKQESHFHEIGIGLDEHENLTRVILPALVDPEILPQGAQEEKDGAIFEHAPARENFAADLAHLIHAQHGAALFIDYGHLKSGFGDTFQAISAHKKADPMKTPGNADLTSHVDFTAIKKAIGAEKISNIELTSQGEFLLNLGLLERAGQLGAGAQEAAQEKIRQDVERLAAPDQMGELFKVLGFASRDFTLAGFRLRIY